MSLKNKLFFAFLYFSEGAPIGFVWWALPAILAEQGHSLTVIATLTALATLPWSFKFVLAPVIDMLSLRGVPLKGQLALFQVLMGLSALGFVPVLQAQKLSWLAPLLFFHACSAAAQDVCIDALAIQSIDERELGAVNGFMQAGMLIGRSIFGGASLFVLSYWGFSPVIYALVAAIWASLIVLALSPLQPQAPQSTSLLDYLRDLRPLVLSRHTFVLFALAYLSGFAFEGLGGTASATLVQIGIPAPLRSLLYSVCVPLFMLSGALVGGWVSDRFEQVSVLRLFLGCAGLSSLGVALCFDYLQQSLFVLPALSTFYLGIGLLTASLYAFLMRHTEKRFAAFQFSLLMAATNLCESSATYLTGQWSPRLGFLPITALLVLLSWATLALLQHPLLQARMERA